MVSFDDCKSVMFRLDFGDLQVPSTSETCMDVRFRSARDHLASAVVGRNPSMYPRYSTLNPGRKMYPSCSLNLVFPSMSAYTNVMIEICRQVHSCYLAERRRGREVSLQTSLEK